MDKVVIGLLGIGNVGIGVWRILLENSGSIEAFLGAKLDIKKILVRDIKKNRSAEIPQEKLTTDPYEIINDPEIQIVVELIGGLEPALTYMKKCLENGKHLVTANKAVIASHGVELFEIAKANGVQLKFEGSVGGGIPIIATLTQSLASNRIDEVVGIINGTTNYILTQMTKYGMSLQDALTQAQEKGYAEADPTSDVEGEDAVFKLAILALIAFGIQVPPQCIPREGIMRISEKEIEYASQLGYTIKLLAKAKRQDNELEIHVHPALVSDHHPLASVNNEFNALFVRGNAVGEIMLYGRGAGSLPTGSAVMSDVMDIAKQIVAGHPTATLRKNGLQKLKVMGEKIGEYYIRLQVVDRPGVLGKITTTFGRHGVSLASVVQEGRGDTIVPLVFVTHQVERSMLNNALDEIATFDVVWEVASILRVENL